MISIFDPLSHIVQTEGSYHLLSYKDKEQLKYFLVSKSPAVKTSTNYKKQHRKIAITEKKQEQ